MVELLEKAIAAVSSLPDSDQEQIGRQLLTHVERIRQLRAELDQGLRSLDAGQGREFDIETFVESKRPRS